MAQRIRTHYLNHVRKHYHPLKKSFTDKLPINFRWIPALAAAFPSAKFIHVHRNPAATCWSIYQTYFTEQKMGWCYSLDDINKYYRCYHALMTAYDESLDIHLHHLSYETLTDDQQNETLRLAKFLDISCERGMLFPHENERQVLTASSQQVRRPVYQNSSDSWRQYEPYIGKLLNDLLPLSF